MNNGSFRGSQRALAVLQAAKEQKNSSSSRDVKRMPTWPPRNDVIDSLAPDDDQLVKTRVKENSKPLDSVSYRKNLGATAIEEENNRLLSNSSSNNLSTNVSIETQIPEQSFALSEEPRQLPSWGIWGNSCSSESANASSSFSSVLTPNLQRNSEHAIESSTTASNNEIGLSCPVIASYGENQLVETEASKPLSSMCFALAEGKVTSLVITQDGEFCIAGFSTGSVRLFDLSASDNIDAEDRFGHLLGRLESANCQTLILHLAVGEPTAMKSSTPLGNSINNSADDAQYCSHLFIGARQGCTKMLVVDLGSLRALKKRRGFITRAGSGVQRFEQSDGKLKGFTALMVTSFQCEQPVQQSDDDAGYRVTYKLICGRGVGNYSVWEAEFVAVPRIDAEPHSPTILSRRGVEMRDAGIVEGLQYYQCWTMLHCGNVTATTMTFATFATIVPHDALCQLELWGNSKKNKQNHQLSSDADSERANSLESELEAEARVEYFENVEEYSNCTATSMSSMPVTQSLEPCLQEKAPRVSLPLNRLNGIEDTEILIAPLDKDLKAIKLSTEMSCPSGLSSSCGSSESGATTVTSKVVAGAKSILASSSDGSVMFGGNEELVVYKYYPFSGDHNHNLRVTGAAPASILAKEVFSITALPSEYCGISNNNGLENQDRRKPRHLRQIEQIWCSSDGSYAIIACSDNAVLLYSVCDVFGSGVDAYRQENSCTFPSSSVACGIGSPVGPQSGKLSLLFQAVDSVKLECCIGYSLPSSRDETSRHSCCNSTNSKWIRPHLSPWNVIVGISWWSPANPKSEAVLRMCRLLSLPNSINTAAKGHTLLLPESICISGIGVLWKYHSQLRREPVRSSKKSRVKDIRCSVCGDCSIVHWNVAETQIVEKAEVEGDKRPIPFNFLSRAEKSKRRALYSEDYKEEEDEAVLGEDDEYSISGRPKKQLKSNDRLSQDGKKVSSASSSVVSKTKSSSMSGDVVLQDASIAKIADLEQELKSARAETEVILRKADRRFQAEKALRVSFNHQRQSWEVERDQLLHQLVSARQALTAETTENRQRSQLLLEASLPFLSALKQLDKVLLDQRINDPIPIDVGETGSSSSCENRIVVPPKSYFSEFVQASSSVVPTIKAPFCIVCQANTADTAITPCGHVCLCFHHACHMESIKALSNCPVCKESCSGKFIQLKGLEAIP